MKKGRWMLVLIVCGASSVSLELAQKVGGRLACGGGPPIRNVVISMRFWGEKHRLGEIMSENSKASPSKGVLDGVWRT